MARHYCYLLQNLVERSNCTNNVISHILVCLFTPPVRKGSSSWAGPMSESGAGGVAAGRDNAARYVMAKTLIRPQNTNYKPHIDSRTIEFILAFVRWRSTLTRFLVLQGFADHRTSAVIYKIPYKREILLEQLF